MLQALVEAAIIPDLVVGASVGAINAVHFGASPDADGVARLGRIWCRIGRRDVFPLSPARSLHALMARGDALVSPRKLRRLLEGYLPCDRLEATALPVHVVATDLASGGEAVLSRGPAVDAVLASTAIPAVFPPMVLGGAHLVDGGIASNTPLAAAARLGAGRLIVLPTGFSCLADPAPHGAVSIALHALNLLIARQLVTDLERLRETLAVHVIPPLCPLARSAYDFSGTEELIERAAESTRRWLQSGGLRRREIPGALRPHLH